jgi:hypothetical protein
VRCFAANSFTREVVLPEITISAGVADQIAVRAHVRSFPLRFAEVVWSDGFTTQRKLFPLDSTRPFGESAFDWRVHSKGWKWARVAFWDIAANGAFVNPVWRKN